MRFVPLGKERSLVRLILKAGLRLFKYCLVSKEPAHIKQLLAVPPDNLIVL